MSIIILQILKLKYFVQEAVKLFKEHFHPILPFVTDHIEVEIRQEQYDACKYMTPTYQSQTYKLFKTLEPRAKNELIINIKK